MAENRVNPTWLVTFAAALGLLYFFRSVLWPLALAFALAVLINAVTRRVTLSLPRAGSRTVGMVTAVVIGGALLGAMATVVSGVAQIVAQAPAVYRQLDHMIAEIDLPSGGGLRLDQLTRHIDSGALAGALVNSLQAAAAGLALTAIYLIFIVVSGRKLDQRVAKIAASRSTDALLLVLERTVKGVQAYTYIQTLTGLIMAIVALSLMWVVGLHNALFWALALFLLSYLPIVGFTFGTLGPTMFALVQFPGPAQAITIFVGLQAVSFVVGNLVLPKMQADSQNIDPAASLLAVGVWTILWGIPGAFLAIPLTLALMYSLAQYKNMEWIAVLMSNDGSPIPKIVDDARSELKGGE
jgi:AI-2 transport protein TqsA